MKRRLNILCALVMLVLGFSISQSITYSSRAFMDGVREGWNSAGESKEFKLDGSSMFGVKLMPNNFAEFNDSIYNEATGSYVKTHTHEVTVILEDTSHPYYVLEFVCFLLSQISILMAVIWFIRLIGQINNSHIFCWKNVHLLRWLGGFLIASFLLELVPIILDSRLVNEAFETPGYTVHSYGSYSIITLLMGIISFIVSEAFAMGLRLQEEQELTI